MPAKVDTAKLAKRIDALEKSLQKLTDRFDKFERLEVSWEREQTHRFKKRDHEFEVRFAKVEAELKKMAQWA